MKTPNYGRCLVNLSCSILSHYGVQPTHKTLPEVDALLAKNFKHVIVMLFDGMGTSILSKHLPENSFLRKHLAFEYDSVFPPTTTSATTSLMTALTPIEHGWLGWSLYFAAENKIVNAFPNTLKDTKIAAAPYNVAKKYLPYKSIFEKISEKNSTELHGLTDFINQRYTNLDNCFADAKNICTEDKNTFTYLYWKNPDADLHLNGTDSPKITKILVDINERVEKFCKDVKDTLVLITADHGHTNIENIILSDYPDFTRMLKMPTSIEPRAVSFFVKDEYKNIFAAEFNKLFGKYFTLYTKDEVLKIQLFGDGAPNANMTSIGDFIGVATGNKALVWSKDSNQFKSHHAGLTLPEIKIPLIAVQCPC